MYSSTACSRLCWNGCSCAHASLKTLYLLQRPNGGTSSNLAPWLKNIDTMVDNLAVAASSLKLRRDVLRFRSCPAPFNDVTFRAAAAYCSRNSMLNRLREAIRVVLPPLFNRRVSTICWMFVTTIVTFFDARSSRPAGKGRSFSGLSSRTPRTRTVMSRSSGTTRTSHPSLAWFST